MHIIRVMTLAGLLCFSAQTVFAGIGAEIGTTVPVGGRSTGADSLENFATLGTGMLVLDADVQEDGGKLVMALQVKNTADQDYVIAHRDGQYYDFVLLDAKGKELYRWSDSMAFTQALTSSAVPANGNVTYTATIAKREYRRLKDQAFEVRMYLKDTPYWVGLRVPKKAGERTSSPMTVHGSISIGNHGW